MTDREQEGALAGTAFAFLAQLTTAAFSAAITLYLVRALGPARYGALSLVLSAAVIAVLISDAALAQSTARFLAPRAGDRRWVAAALSAGLRLKLVAATVVCLAMVGLAGPIAHAYREPELEWPLRLAVLAVYGESLMLLWTTAFQAVRRISVSVRLLFLESAVEAAATIGLVAAGGGVAGAVLGRGVGYAFGALVGGVLVVRHLRTRLRVRSGDREARRQIARYARPLLLNTSVYTLYSQVDLQMVGVFLSHALVGVFAAPFKVITLLCYPGQSAANAVSPRMAGEEPDVGAFTTAVRWLLVYQVALVAPVIVWAGPITRVMLGPGFEQSALVLATLAPYLLLRGVSTLASTTVNYLGHARRRVPIVLLSLAVLVVLGIALLPTVGLVGATVALSVSYAVYVPLHLRICHESFGLPLRRLGLTALRCAAAAAAMAIVLAGTGSGHPQAGRWLLWALLGIGVYVGMLVGLQELAPADLRQVWWVARRAGAVAARVGASSAARAIRPRRETPPAGRERLPSTGRSSGARLL